MRLLLFLTFLLAQSLAAQSFLSPIVFPATSMGDPFSLAAGADGSLFVAGTFRDSINFGPIFQDSTLYRSEPTAFVCHYFTSGALDWVHLIEGGPSAAYDLHRSESGSLFVVGRFDGILTFGPGFMLNSGAEPDGFVWKLAEDGTVLEARNYRAFIDEGAATLVTTDANDNLYIAGFYDKDIDVDLDPTPGSLALLQSPIGKDLFVTKYDADFNLQWAESIGVNTDYIFVRALLVDDEGHAYVVGAFDDTIDFDDEPVSSAGGLDFFVAKHHPTSNNWLWYHTYGGDADEVIQAAVFSNSAQDELLLSGYFTGDFEFGSNTLNISPNAEKAGFLLRSSASGQPVAAAALDAGNSTQIYDLITTSDGTQLVLGNFSGNLPLEGGGNIEPDSTSTLFVGQLTPELTLSAAVRVAQGTFFDPPFFLPIGWPELIETAAGSLALTAVCRSPTLVGGGASAVNVVPNSNAMTLPKPNFILWINDFPLPSGINQLTAQDETVVLYPNPGKNKLTIQASTQVSNLRLVDSNGRIVLEQPGPSSTSWDVSKLPAGNYQLSGKTELGWFVKSYIKSQ